MGSLDLAVSLGLWIRWPHGITGSGGHLRYLDQRVYAQTTYNQENLAFCFQLCTVAHFVGFLMLPWFSSS
jgi:hypothetical protein